MNFGSSAGLASPEFPDRATKAVILGRLDVSNARGTRKMFRTWKLQERYGMHDEAGTHRGSENRRFLGFVVSLY